MYDVMKSETIELKRLNKREVWGICYAILPSGPEILKVLQGSPAFGRLKSGQVIKTVNGQSIIGLTREDVQELMDIGETELVLDVLQPNIDTIKCREFGKNYGLLKLPARRYSDFVSIAKNGFNHIGTNIKKQDSTLTQIPNVLHEYERIHKDRLERRLSTCSQFESARFQRCVSVDRPIIKSNYFHSSNTEKCPMIADVSESNQISSKEGIPPSGKQSHLTKTLDHNLPLEANMSSIRYMGVQIPSRSFQALARLMKMDEPGTELSHFNTAASSTEPCRTVIDVRATAKIMQEEKLVEANRNLRASSLVPFDNYTCPLPTTNHQDIFQPDCGSLSTN